jgi:hypothetical protein
VKNTIRRLASFAFSGAAAELREEIFANRLLMGKMLANRVAAMAPGADIQDAEFKVFSQNGEDGIIQYLINNIAIENDTFVEFGVSNYREANTRFLLINDNWKGLVLDGSADNIKSIRSEAIYWKHELSAEYHFITRDNINSIISGAGISGDIGLLSIDIDGNDYWVWQAIDVIAPRIVVCEYNSVFGCEHPVTVPYDEKFDRATAHHSCLYFGASLPALCLLAEQKGYDFVGSDSTGINAFFVRNDLSHGLKRLSATEGYVKSRHRESRDAQGKLTFVSGDARLGVIADMDVVNVSSNKVQALGSITAKK